MCFYESAEIILDKAKVKIKKWNVGTWDWGDGSGGKVLAMQA